MWGAAINEELHQPAELLQDLFSVGWCQGLLEVPRAKARGATTRVFAEGRDCRLDCICIYRRSKAVVDRAKSGHINRASGCGVFVAHLSSSGGRVVQRGFASQTFAGLGIGAFTAQVYATKLSMALFGRI